MQQKQKRINANYIDPEASAVMANNHLTTTVEQDEAEAEALRLWFEQQAKLPEWRMLYADEIEATIDCYLSNARQLGEGGTCRKLKISTNVRATFAKLLVSRSFFIIHKLKFQICQ